MSSVLFDPSKFTAPKAKPLPVILLLDVSGSMSGEKIRNLNAAVRDMVSDFSDTETSEVEIHLAVITFGAQVKVHQALTSASAVEWHDLSTGGATPLGTALQLAKAMLEDKECVPSRAYRPTVVLVSDGQPTDAWEMPLKEFINDGRSSKCDRIAMAIGADADEVVLGKFFDGTAHQLMYAENAKQLRECFKYITMSVTVRMRSQTPNIVPIPDVIDVKPTTITSRAEKPTPVTPNASDQDGGYW